MLGSYAPLPALTKSAFRTSVPIISKLEAMKVDESFSEAGPEEDPFAESDEWIAAEIRQLFRAMSAFDAKGLEVCQLYFYHYLANTIGRQMRKVVPWDAEGFWQDGFDATELHIEIPARMRLTGWLTCVLPSGEGSGKAEEWGREPFQIEVRLHPLTGHFLGYRVHVGNHRPRQEKAIVGIEIGGRRRIELEPAFQIVDMTLSPPTPVGGWLATFVRGDFSEGSG